MTEPDADDDSRLRSALGIILGACLALVPVFAGRMDLQTFLIVSLVGAISILPVWRHVGRVLNTRWAILGILELVIGPLVVGRVFSALAILTYLGAWAATLGVMRFLTGWRDQL